jgi:NAD(P)-dependent dehydrogenase (short-subunit alcohol dehydrogenase family)
LVEDLGESPIVRDDLSATALALGQPTETLAIPMNISLDGKTAIITGAASGVGLATTLEFLASGAAGVVAVDIRDDCPAELREAEALCAGRLAYFAGDVSREETSERMTATAIDRFGRIDVLVNNAGVSVVKPLHTHTSDEWDRVMDTNVKAIYWAATRVVPIMLRQQSGVILNTGSISGLVGITGQGAYAASKGAVHQMTRQMAVEYASGGIRVNAVALGTVDTPIVYRAARESPNPETFVDDLRRQHPLGRIATAQEAATFITFLASDQAAFFTGAILSLDGGFTAK